MTTTASLWLEHNSPVRHWSALLALKPSDALWLVGYWL